MKQLLIILLTVYSLASFGQNVMKKSEATVTPKAGLEVITWLEGHWKGHAGGSEIEEIWSNEKAGAMMGMFRSYENGTVSFYEFMTIQEVESSLKLNIKHFTRDMIGWEEKDESAEFDLLKVTANKVYFDGLTFEHDGKHGLNIYVNVSDPEGNETETKFSYHKK